MSGARKPDGVVTSATGAAEVPSMFAVPSGGSGLLVAALYGLCSMMMAFSNKALMNNYKFDFQFTLMTCQMLFTALFLDSLRHLGFIHLPPYSFGKGFQFLLPSFFYGIHSVLSLTALSGMNIPMYGVIKRCGPFVTMVLGIFLLGKGRPSLQVVVSVVLITTGCLVAGYGDLMSFDLYSYSAGGASLICQALYLVLLQRIAQSEQTTMSATETLHLNSYNTLPVMMLGAIFTGEVDKSIQFFRSSVSADFFVIFTVVTTMGCMLNYLVFLCTTLNSALTTSIVGITKSVIQTFIGMFTFGGIDINVFTVSGILINFSGGIIYTFGKYREHRKKSLLSTRTTENV